MLAVTPIAPWTASSPAPTLATYTEGVGGSELKRAHGLGRLRVRGGRRVRLAVYLKALACNFKRMVHARLVEMENTAQRAVGTVPVKSINSSRLAVMLMPERMTSNSPSRQRGRQFALVLRNFLHAVAVVHQDGIHLAVYASTTSTEPSIDTNGLPISVK